MSSGCDKPQGGGRKRDSAVSPDLAAARWSVKVTSEAVCGRGVMRGSWRCRERSHRPESNSRVIIFYFRESVKEKKQAIFWGFGGFGNESLYLLKVFQDFRVTYGKVRRGRPF